MYSPNGLGHGPFLFLPARGDLFTFWIRPLRVDVVCVQRTAPLCSCPSQPPHPARLTSFSLRRAGLRMLSLFLFPAAVPPTSALSVVPAHRWVPRGKALCLQPFETPYIRLCPKITVPSQYLFVFVSTVVIYDITGYFQQLFDVVRCLSASRFRSSLLFAKHVLVPLALPEPQTDTLRWWFFLTSGEVMVFASRSPRVSLGAPLAPASFASRRLSSLVPFFLASQFILVVSSLTLVLVSPCGPFDGCSLPFLGDSYMDFPPPVFPPRLLPPGLIRFGAFLWSTSSLVLPLGFALRTVGSVSFLPVGNVRLPRFFRVSCFSFLASLGIMLPLAQCFLTSRPYNFRPCILSPTHLIQRVCRGNGQYLSCYTLPPLASHMVGPRISSREGPGFPPLLLG